MELDRSGITYSEDTLAALREQYPKAELFFIIGADQLCELHNWRGLERLLGQCGFLVCPRRVDTGAAEYMAEYRRLAGLGARLTSIPMESVNISSTQAREAIRCHTPCDLLSPAVREYAEITGLYGTSARIPEAAEWLPKLFHDLTAKRFSHTLAVAYTARSLALHHDVDPLKAERAALLHDCAKCFPLEEMQRICTESGKPVDPSLMDSGSLLHSVAGSILAESAYGVHDPEILRAIACHTTGRVGMTRLDMVVYLADKIEPTRASYPLLDRVRMLSLASLEKAMLASMEGTASYVTKKGGKPLHPQTNATIAWLKTLPETASK